MIVYSTLYTVPCDNDNNISMITRAVLICYILHEYKSIYFNKQVAQSEYISVYGFQYRESNIKTWTRRDVRDLFVKL